MASPTGRAVDSVRKSLAMGPSVRNLLSQYKLEPSQIASTGPHQTLLKGDVLAYVNQNNLQPVEHGRQTLTAKTHVSVSSSKGKVFTPNLDISGYQPKPGPEGFSKHVKELLKM